MDTKINAILIQFVSAFIVLTIIGNSHGATDSAERRTGERKFYVCPPDFIRLKNKCYFYSTDKATWQDAEFSCKDKGSNLTAPERWEDTHIRQYLNKTSRGERWIGGIYNWKAKAWKWAGEMKEMKYQSFRRIRNESPENLEWHCVAMVPEYEYRWEARKCMEKKLYICQTNLLRVKKTQRDELRKKWKKNGNEILAPKMDIPYRKTPKKDQTYNVNPSNIINNEIPNALTKPIRIKNHYVHNNRTAWIKQNRKRNRIDPQSIYLHNIRVLKNENSNLTVAQRNKYLRRLERMRKREENNKRREEKMRERQNRLQNSVYENTDPNSLSQSPSNIRSRNIDGKRNKNKKKGHGNKKNGKKHSIEYVTQRTYLEDNGIGELPKQIVEVHDFHNQNII